MVGRKKTLWRSCCYILRLKQGQGQRCGGSSVFRKFFCSQTIKISCANQRHRHPRNAAVWAGTTYTPSAMTILGPRVTVYTSLLVCPHLFKGGPSQNHQSTLSWSVLRKRERRRNRPWQSQIGNRIQTYLNKNWHGKQTRLLRKRRQGKGTRRVAILLTQFSLEARFGSCTHSWTE